jgi:hypothetical protein
MFDGQWHQWLEDQRAMDRYLYDYEKPHTVAYYEGREGDY